MDAVVHGVAARDLERLWVDVHGIGLCRAELDRGDGKYARAAAVIEKGFAGERLLRQPGETQRGGRVIAGAEGESGVENDIHGIRFGRGAPARDHPQAATGLERLVMRHPRMRPVFVAEQIDLMRRRFRKIHQPARAREDVVGVGVFRKQSGDHDLRPDRIFVPEGLEQRLVGRVLERHRDRAPFLERVRQRLGVTFINAQFQFEPGHRLVSRKSLTGSRLTIFGFQRPSFFCR